MGAIILVVLLGGCLLMHIFKMRRGGHSGNHESNEGKEREKKEKNHSSHGCCH